MAELHHLVDTGVVGGMTMENPKDEHALLDMLLRHFPESLRVIRRSDGLPTAFTTLVPLHKEAIALLPRPIIEALRERLGTELSRYERISAEATDTLLSVITTVPLEPEEFTFFDLLLAIKLTGWSELAHGNRCLLFSSIPDVKTFHLQLGYEYLNPRGAHHQSVDVCALDFRNQSMGQWLVSLLLDATISPPSFHAQSSKHISTEMVRDALKSLRNTRLLMQSQLAKMLELSGDELYQELMALLTDIAPQAPLTAMLQNVLRLSYLNGMSIVAIAHELNVGRTTYYRYLDRALDALRQVLAVKQDEGLESLSDVGGLNHQNR
ncbi:helix-turn-helix domain-containing protein [Alicyclobacillus curvatus]|nr:helix-turn-helix domain-containing protein [Alicyclobacillus curvatus]